MRKIINFCDYFVICTAASDRRIRAIADAIEENTAPLGIKPYRVQGAKEGAWVIVDFAEVVVHIFDPGMRDFYNLEHLWQDAVRIQWQK